MRTISPIIIEIRCSKMLENQIGLFSVRALKKGQIIAEAKKLDEKFIPWSTVNGIDPLTRRKISQYCLQTDEGLYLPKDFNYLTVPWNMNHSCDYNVGFDDKGNFVTVRNVQANEELTWDYGMGFSDPRYNFKCECKSKICRHKITGNDWKNRDFVEKNKEYFLRELLKKARIYFKSHKS